ncbi:MAG: hypothetical protein JWL90_4379, partial [Chthoniobacteraceae bacterium]|nr:hypothetical protein [Chthoniobacteraceae bacterium]
NRWENRPSLEEVYKVDLLMGCVRDQDTDLSKHHLSLSHEAFADWKPIVIRYAKVFRFEREAYEQWKELGGQIFLW